MMTPELERLMRRPGESFAEWLARVQPGDAVMPRNDDPPFRPYSSLMAPDRPEDYLLEEPPPQAPYSNGHGAIESIEVKGGERHLAADRGLQALAAAQVPFYQRGTKMVRVARVKAKNASGETFLVPGIVPVTDAILDRALGQSVPWVRFDVRTKKHVAIDPPKPVVQQILGMVDEWPFPPLRGIIQCPTLRRDGSLLDAEGYDEQTGLVLSKSLKMPPIPDRPTREDAEASLAQLNMLLTEFPFVDDEGSHAVALSMIMTPVLRAAMEVAPMHLVNKPAPGTGASYLADVASMIATGNRCAVKAQGRNPEETEKRLIGSALEGRPIIALDNCHRVLEGDFLCQVTERPLLELRALGKSDQHIIANSFCIFANGNNITVADDMVRRTIRCAMDANRENPELRSFKSSPLAMISANRGNFVAACLTIARAYVAAGRPNQSPPLASFEQWSAIVRDPLVWLGCRDPVATMDALRKEDPAGVERHRVFEAWKLRIGVDRPATTSEIIEIANSDTPLRDALRAVASRRLGTEIDPKELGKWLSSQEKTIAAGCKLKVDRLTNKAKPKWYLEFP
jgi:putative DNA primase/helicase